MGFVGHLVVIHGLSANPALPAGQPHNAGRGLARAPGNIPSHSPTGTRGGVVEWFNAPVLKTGEPERVPGVRIPPPPPDTPLTRVGGVCFAGCGAGACQGRAWRMGGLTPRSQGRERAPAARGHAGGHSDGRPRGSNPSASAKFVSWGSGSPCPPSALALARLDQGFHPWSWNPWAERTAIVSATPA